MPYGSREASRMDGDILAFDTYRFSYWSFSWLIESGISADIVRFVQEPRAGHGRREKYFGTPRRGSCVFKVLPRARPLLRGALRMTSGPRERVPRLALVQSRPGSARAKDDNRGSADGVVPRAVDWSILMAHAQGGDVDAYRRLLEDLTPYLRTLAARHNTDPSELEDAVQDILLTVHAIRNIYDPTRPFGPWLAAIANRRLVDRFRRQGRRRRREIPLTPEHETFPANEANIETVVSDRRDLEGAVERLPASERQAILLLKLKQMSLKEAAAACGMSIAALKAATHRALKHLRRILSTGNDDA
jgi:RNA polymerase sigma-70 factor (ECF subfamily)